MDATGTQEKLDEVLGLLHSFHEGCKTSEALCNLDDGRHALQQLQATIVILKKSLRVAIGTLRAVDRAIAESIIYGIT